MYIPIADGDDVPLFPMAAIDVMRRTRTNLENADEKYIDDVWCGVREHSDFWAGGAVFYKLRNPPPGNEQILGRPTRAQKTARPGDICPDMWKLMSTAQKKKAVADWRVKSEQVNEARKRRGISAEVHGMSLLNLYVQPKTHEMNDARQNTAPQCDDGAGGDSCNNASGAIPPMAGSDLCALMNSSGAGGDASRSDLDDAPKLTCFATVLLQRTTGTAPIQGLLYATRKELRSAKRRRSPELRRRSVQSGKSSGT